MTGREKHDWWLGGELEMADGANAGRRSPKRVALIKLMQAGIEAGDDGEESGV